MIFSITNIHCFFIRLSVFIQVNKASGCWSSDLLLSMLHFNSAERAKEWVKSDPKVSDENWLGGCQIALVTPKENFQSGMLP